MAVQIPMRQLTHKQKVLSLYKKSIRFLECYYHERLVFRYNAVLMRKQFDDNKCIKDLDVAQKLIAMGEEQLFNNQHPQPKKFANSVGGNTYLRAPVTPDWVLDHWHPLEKAQYPEYFATREIRKKEYIRNWEKEFGKDTPADHH